MAHFESCNPYITLTRLDNLGYNVSDNDSYCLDILFRIGQLIRHGYRIAGGPGTCTGLYPLIRH